MTKHLRFLFVMLLAMIWSGVMFAQKTETITIADYVPSSGNKAITAEAPLLQNGFKIYIEKKSGNNPGLWNKGNNLRFYDKDILHIESSNGDMTSVEFTVTSDFSIKGMSSNIWSGTPSASLSFTGSGTNKITVIKITYTDSSSSAKTDTKVSFSENSGKTFTFTEGKYTYGTFTTPTATETNGVAGTVAYSSSNATAISVDASTGALSFPGYGEATITATFTPNNTETYAKSTDSYKVKNERGVVAGTITFDKANGAFDVLNPTNKGYGTAKYNFVSDTNESYTFDCKGVMKTYANKGCLQIQKTTGKVASPAFPKFTNGYKVNIIYSSKKALKLSAGDANVVIGTTTSSNNTNGLGASVSISVPANVPFVITSGGSEVTYVSKIEIIPNKIDETETLTLNESATNTIEAKSGVNVTLKRTMVKGEWNTICLPFSVTEDKAKAAFGNDVKIVELDEYATVDHNVLSFKASTGIVAATPYLIKPSAVADEYTFENVDITDKAAGYSMTKNADIAFKGIYNTVDITSDVVDAKFGDTYYAAFLGAGNKIYKANGSGNKTKGFRAYFAIPKSASASALRVVIDGTATSIKNIDSEVVESNAPVYNLQGQRVDGNNLTPGIYVKAGKKFVVK